MRIETVLYYIVLTYISLWLVTGLFAFIAFNLMKQLKKYSDTEIKLENIMGVTINLREKLSKEGGLSEKHPLIEQMDKQIISIHRDIITIEKKNYSIVKNLSGFLGAAGNFLFVLTFGKLRLHYSMTEVNSKNNHYGN